MNRFSIIVISILCVTLIAVAYVAQAVSHVKLSYRINEYSKELSAYYEEHRRLKFELAALSSPAHLEKQCELHGLDLVVPRAVRFIELPALDALPLHKQQTSQTRGLFGDLHFTAIAQAETSDS